MNLFEHFAPWFLICALSLIFGCGALEILVYMATRAVMLSRAKRLCNFVDCGRPNAGILPFALRGERKVWQAGQIQS